MSWNDDLNIDTDSEKSELSEKEYSDILGLEDMAGGGEAALPEDIEEEKEDTLSFVPVEEIKQKSKQVYRKYSNDEETEPQGELPIQQKIPLEQTAKWKDSTISEQEANNDEKHSSTEYRGYLQNNVSDVNMAGQSNTEGQKHIAAEQGKIDTEASVQAHETKEEPARAFHTSVEVDNKVINAYEQGKSAVQHMTEDDFVAEGHRETEKYVKPVTLAVAMYASGSAVSNIKSEMDKTIKAVQETVSLVEQGKISLLDLNGKKKELSEKLTALEIPKESIHRIVRGCKDSYDFIITQASLMDMDTSKNILEPRQREYLNSQKFFDIRKKETHELVALYFKNSKNEVLQKTNVMGLSVKDSKKLERSAENNGLTSRDISAVRAARKLGELKRARIALGATKTRAYIRAFYDLSRNMKDELLDEGLQTLSVSQKVGFAAYSATKAGIAAGRVSVHLINKIPAVRWVESRAVAGARYVGKRTVQGIKDAGAYVSMPIKTTAKAVKHMVAKKIEKNVPKKTIASIRKARAGAVEKGKRAMVKAKKVSAGVKKGAETVGRGARAVTTPFRLLGGGLNTFFSFLNKVKIKIAIAFIGVAAAYMLLIAVMSMLIAIGTSSGEGIATTILSRDTGLVASMVNTLQVELDEREAGAVPLTETVKNPEVFGGRTIDRYGYQKEDGTWTDGYKITHVDPDGVQIASGANNSKDVIILTYLLMQADFDSYANARDKLLLDMWDIMNPCCTYEETDIYTCTIGCEKVYYCCNDSVTLNATGHAYDSQADIQGYKDEGVFFNDSIITNTYGDFYTSVCNGHEEGDTTYSHGSKTGTGEADAPGSSCDNYSYAYYCDGHSVDACFGHKDIEIIVTTIYMEQMFETNELPTRSTGANYGSYWTRLSKFKSNPEAWDNGWTENYIAWANSLYNQNWTNLYGIDPLGGISTCPKVCKKECKGST